MFGRKTHTRPAKSSGGGFITHNLELTGRCPDCKCTVTAPHKHSALLGTSGTVSAYATCGCGNVQVPVSDEF